MRIYAEPKKAFQIELVNNTLRVPVRDCDQSTLNSFSEGLRQNQGFPGTEACTPFAGWTHASPGVLDLM